MVLRITLDVIAPPRLCTPTCLRCVDDIRRYVMGVRAALCLE
jgi:hypothetical protein